MQFLETDGLRLLLSYKPLSDVDNESEKLQKSNETSCDDTNEMNGKMNNPLYRNPNEVCGGGSSKNMTQEFFLDNSTTNNNNNRASELVEYLSFQQLNYGCEMGVSVNPNANLCFNQNPTSSEIISGGFNSNMVSILQQQHHPKSTSSCEMQNWEGSNFFEGNNNINNNYSSWGLPDCGKSEKNEDIKWSEYLPTPQNPFMMGIQNQESHSHSHSQQQQEQEQQGMYVENIAAAETGFITERGSVPFQFPWQQQQQQQPQQNHNQRQDVYNKHLHTLTVSFGQTL